MQMEWQTGKVVSIIDETHNTKRFFIETPFAEPFHFKPGQFVTLDLPIHEKKNKRWRSYSIASAPDTTNLFELVIVLVDDGLGTNHLFKNVKVGDEIIYRGPAGVFTLPDEVNHNLYLICTGTGIAPFRSMIHYIYNNKVATKDINLIYGTRTQGDLLYFKEMIEFQQLLPQLKYIPVLSREVWEGKKGYVHDVYTLMCQQDPHASFMLCGWKNMIDEARERLQNLGYDKKQIHFELYG